MSTFETERKAPERPPGPGKRPVAPPRRRLRRTAPAAPGDRRPLNVASLRRDTQRRRALAIADVLALIAAFTACAALKPFPATLPIVVALVGALPVWVVLNKLLGLYDRDPSLIHKSTLDELPRLIESVVLGSTLLAFFGSMVAELSPGRTRVVLFVALTAVLMPTLRAVARAVVVRRAQPERCLIVGSGAVAHTLAEKIGKHPEYGVQLAGVLDEGEARIPGATVSRLPSIDEFEDLCRSLQVERVVIAFSSLSHDELLDVISMSKRLSLKVSILPRLFEAIGQAVEIDEVEGMMLLGMSAVTRTKSSLWLKRGIDITIAGLGLIVLSPVLLAIAVAIKLNSRGSVLYSQYRIGRGERPFRLLKFRTMYTGADALKHSLAHLNEASSPMFKIASDPRVTPVGRVLRRFSLDELPQLWNVLRGEMSLVGPRPLVPDEDGHVLGRHRTRLELTPGLTGPWQVMGRTAIPFGEMIRLDYLYVAEWSLWNDIKLLVRTAPVVFSGKGH